MMGDGKNLETMDYPIKTFRADHLSILIPYLKQMGIEAIPVCW